MRNSLSGIAGAIVALAVVGASAAMSSGIDNSTWHVKEKGKMETMDTLVFVNGEFISTECVPYGFLKSSYNAKQMGKATEWTATLTNGDQEKMEWMGKVEMSGTMSGTYKFTDKSGKTTTKEWTAERATKK